MAKELEIYEGQPLTFTLPTGATVTIREHNATDDDIITKGINKGGAAIIDNLNRYVAAIILNHSAYSGRVSIKDVEDFKLMDKYYIIYKSRLHSIGDMLEFDYTWGGKDDKPKRVESYEVDISEYDRDLSLPDNEYDEYSIRPYDNSDQFFEFQLASGRRIRLEYLTGRGEKFVLEQGRTNNLAASAEILSRFPKVLVEAAGEEKWMEIKNVNIFSKKDSIEIKKQISQKDKQFNMSTLVRDEETGETDEVNLLGIKGFFFPEGI